MADILKFPSTRYVGTLPLEAIDDAIWEDAMKLYRQKISKVTRKSLAGRTRIRHAIDTLQEFVPKYMADRYTELGLLWKAKIWMDLYAEENVGKAPRAKA